jgi:hypothetical protein
LEPNAPPPRRPRTALSAALSLRVPVLVLCALITLLGSASTAVSAPQPDAAPQAPVPSPDPAPGAGGAPTQPTQPAPTSSVAPASGAPASSAPAPPSSAAPTSPAPSAERPAASSDAADKREARRVARERARRHRAATRAAASERSDRGDQAQQPATDPSAIARIALAADLSPADDNTPRLLLLAACALLALLCASGSFVSVASRMFKGQLR